MTEPLIGVVGLGAMGGPIAHHLIDIGDSPVVFDEDVDRMAEFTLRGARAASSAEDVASTVDWVLLFLPGPAEVMATSAGIRTADAAPTGVVDFTTSDPSVSVAVHDELVVRGIRYLDAGVLGNPPLARSGDLLLLLGCAESDAADAEQVLAKVSRRTFFLGRPGAGHAAKLAANELFTGQVAAMAEALTFLRSIDGDQSVFLDALSATGGRGVGLADIGRTMLSEPPATGFALRLAAKDVTLLKGMADSTGVDLPLVRALTELFAGAAATDGHSDYTRVYQYLDRRRSEATL